MVDRGAVRLTSLLVICQQWREMDQVPANEACVHFLGLPQQTATNWVIYNDGNIFSHSFGARRLKPRCRQGHGTLKAPGRIRSLCPSLPSGATGRPGTTSLVSASPVSASLITCCSFCICFHMAMSSFSSCSDASPIGLEAHPASVCPHINSLRSSTMTLFPNQVTF